jgi:hypothetical protein
MEEYGNEVSRTIYTEKQSPTNNTVVTYNVN